MSKLSHSNPDLDDVYTGEEELERMNVCVWDVRFYMNDDDGNELLNDDGSVKLFTAPDLNLDVIVQHVEYGFVSPDDLEEVK